MPAKTKQDLRAALIAAQNDQAHVRVIRSIKRSQPLSGFVVALGAEWVLLCVLDPSVFLDGYVAVRVKDVLAVERRGDEETFVGRALHAAGEWPPTSPDWVALEDAAALVRSAGLHYSLVTVWTELDGPSLAIGYPTRFTKKAVRLCSVSPQAQWEARAVKCPLAGITRVEFGGRYAKALRSVAGPPPIEAVAG